MEALGFDRFAVVGHDRGARIARLMALDHPGSVRRLAALDIVPTAAMYRTLDQAHATAVWRYFFLVQRQDLPEWLIGADPGYYLAYTLREWCGTPDALTPAAVAEYRRCFDPAAIHASCEDYRAGATVDLDHDASDVRQRITCPTLVLWSADGLGAATTSWPPGASRPTKCADALRTAATSWPRSGRKRSPGNCWRSWTAADAANSGTE